MPTTTLQAAANLSCSCPQGAISLEGGQERSPLIIAFPNLPTLHYLLKTAGGRRLYALKQYAPYLSNPLQVHLEGRLLVAKTESGQWHIEWWPVGKALLRLIGYSLRERVGILSF
ncbi:hypothetical protein [Phaeodactylibacter luteus]|uniref:Uncharacterized protein n=1 Tax=Phaeodactylibacter luteus TaxID=1564516 RepID=A0A5C6RZH6_9BACT|nr:hypothetical protein [Phaeodactylibacter luteus]TXB67563.1 hypothetical protein FRY97_03995 [Phaeodactylibacter luteus]